MTTGDGTTQVGPKVICSLLLLDLYLKLHNEGDFEGVARRCYRQDCVVMAPERPLAHHSGVKDLYAKSDVKRYVAANDESVTEGNMAVTHGHYPGFREDGSVAKSGRYMVMWIQIYGTWLMKSVLWNNSQ